jgi:hypothetical protein
MGDASSLVVDEFASALYRLEHSDALEQLPEPEARALGQVLARYTEAYAQSRLNRDVEAAVAGLAEAFGLELVTLITANPDLTKQFLETGPRELTSACRTAASDVLAPLIWARAVGESWDTHRTSQFLEVSRQALHKRVVNGSVLGIPGERTTWFPVWQFDFAQRSVRPEVRAVVGAFQSKLGRDLDPLVIASWATTEQPEDLLGNTPAQWLEGASFEASQVVVAAKRAAARLAQ